LSVVIRPMIAADIDAVYALAQKTPEAPHWNRSAYEPCINGNQADSMRYVGWVADEAKQVAGFLVAKLVAGICEIESIAVAEDVRGRGIGAALMTAATSWAKSQGATRLELEVRASNATAIRLYERFGLRLEGLRARYYIDPEEDAVLMGKALDAVENFEEKRVASRPPEC